MAHTVIPKNVMKNRRIRNTLGIPSTPKTREAYLVEKLTEALREFKGK